MRLMSFEYKVVDSVEEANRLSAQGFERFTILPPGPTGGADPRYTRRAQQRARTP